MAQKKKKKKKKEQIPFLPSLQSTITHCIQKDWNPFSQQLYKFIAMLSQNRHNQHTQCTVLKERAAVLGVLGLLVRFVKKTASVQELTNRNKAFTHTLKHCSSIKTIREWGALWLCQAPPRHRLHTLSLIKHMECNPRRQALPVVSPAPVNVMLVCRHGNLSRTLHSFTFTQTEKKKKKSTDSNNNDRNFHGDAQLWDVMKFPVSNWLVFSPLSFKKVFSTIKLLKKPVFRK